MNIPLQACDNTGRIHGDGVPYGKGKLATLDVIDYSSMTSVGNILDRIQMWTCIPSKFICSEAKHGISTMYHVWKWIVYDLVCLMNGVFMDVNAFGEPWGAEFSDRPQSGRIMGQYTMAIMQLGAFEE